MVVFEFATGATTTGAVVSYCRVVVVSVTWVVGALGAAYAAAGNRVEAMRILQELLDRAERETIDFSSIAAIYATLGDVENALTSLEKACDARGMSGVMVNMDPRYAGLRGEPRFQNILKRMNLA